jgi:hypothetical protein
MRIVVTDEFEQLDDRLDGTLLIMREIAKIAGKRERGRVFGLLVPAGLVQQDAPLKEIPP